MDTETTIETNLAISVHYGGVAPIGGGRMSFSPLHISRVAPSNDNTFVKRILFADLVTVASNKVFQLVYGDGFLQDYNGGPLTNPAGEVISFSGIGRLLFIKSSVATGIIATANLPESVDVGGALLLDSQFEIGTPANGDPVIELAWTTAAITAVGNANFYCDLILAVS